MNAFRAHEFEMTKKVADREQPADHAADFGSLIAVIMFSVIGLLIAANLIFRISDPALTVEQVNIFVGP